MNWSQKQFHHGGRFIEECVQEEQHREMMEYIPEMYTGFLFGKGELLFLLAPTAIPSRKKKKKKKNKDKKKKKTVPSEDPIGTGSSKLPITLGKMAGCGEQNENCHFSGLAA